MIFVFFCLTLILLLLAFAFALLQSVLKAAASDQFDGSPITSYLSSKPTKGSSLTRVKAEACSNVEGKALHRYNLLPVPAFPPNLSDLLLLVSLLTPLSKIGLLAFMLPT